MTLQLKMLLILQVLIKQKSFACTLQPYGSGALSHLSHLTPYLAAQHVASSGVSPLTPDRHASLEALKRGHFFCLDSLIWEMV